MDLFSRQMRPSYNCLKPPQFVLPVCLPRLSIGAEELVFEPFDDLLEFGRRFNGSGKPRGIVTVEYGRELLERVPQTEIKLCKEPPRGQAHVTKDFISRPDPRNMVFRNNSVVVHRVRAAGPRMMMVPAVISVQNFVALSRENSVKNGSLRRFAQYVVSNST